MQTIEQIATDGEARERADKDEPSTAAHEGAQMLDELWLGLQRLQRGYDMLADKGPDDEEKSVWIRKGGALAKWTRRGRTLVFSTAAGGVAESASVPDAIGITVYFLITGELLEPAGQRAPLSFLAK
jgi:hypothetical protein